MGDGGENTSELFQQRKGDFMVRQKPNYNKNQEIREWNSRTVERKFKRTLREKKIELIVFDFFLFQSQNCDFVLNFEFLWAHKRFKFQHYMQPNWN